MKSPFRAGSNKLPDPQVKGDFDALLNSDGSKAVATRQPPVLLDLRKSGSFKPQSSVDSAASFATAASSASDGISEAAGPTHTSTAASSLSAGDAHPLSQDSADVVGRSPSTAQQEEQARNGVLTDMKVAAQSAPDALKGTTEPTAAEGQLGTGSMGAPKEHSGRAEAPEAGPGSTSEASVTGDMDARAALEQAQDNVPPTQEPQLSSSDPVEEVEIPGPGRSVPYRKLYPDRKASGQKPHMESAAAAEAQPQSNSVHVDAAQNLSSSVSHPLDSPSLRAVQAKSEATQAPQHVPEHGTAAPQDPLQGSQLSEDSSPEQNTSSDPSQASKNANNCRETKSQDSGSLKGAQDDAGEARGHRCITPSRGAEPHEASKQAPIPAQPEQHANRGAQGSAAPSLQPPGGPQQHTAAPGSEHFQDPHEDLSSAQGAEASEELPVSTLGARCLSGGLPGNLPEPPRSSPAGIAQENEEPGHAEQHEQPAGENVADSDHEPEGEELKEWRPAAMRHDAESTEHLGSPGHNGQGPHLQGSASLESSAVYELKPFEPQSSALNGAAVQQPHHVRHASTFTESLGGHTGSEAGTAPGDLEDDHSVAAASEASEASSAPPAAPGPEAAAMQRAASGATSLGRAAAHAAAEVLQQDEHSAAWRGQRKHFFVLSNAGRPVFTAHGSEHALAGFMAIIDAMMSFVKDRGDNLRSMRSGEHLIVFLEKGPLYLVAVSAAGEPEAALALQLELLHAHLLAILTNSFDRMLARNPRFEPRRLLGGTEDVLRLFLRSFETSPAAMLGAFEPLHLPSAMRHSTLVSLQSAVKRSDAMYGVLLADERVVALAQPRAHALHAHDMLLLASFVLGSDSFRAAAESFSPICLPRFNPAAFLHAYVRFLDEASGLCLVLLSTHQEAFHSLSDAAKRLQSELQDEGTFQVIARILARPGAGRLCLDRLPRSAGGGACGETALHHFLYRATPRAQFVMPAFSPPLNLAELRQEVMPAYARAHAAVHDAQGAVRQRVHFCCTDERVLLAYVGAEYEVFAQFDALTDRGSALAVCQRLCAYIKKQQSDLFVPMSL